MRYTILIATVLLTIFFTRMYYGIGTPQNTCGMDDYMTYIEDSLNARDVLIEDLSDQVDLLNNIIKK